MSFTKIVPQKDQIQIELDKLVPFNNHSLDLFRGQRFTEMIDSINRFGVYAPITVRPLDNIRYEILNGHYRVAAAKKLKLESIPAVVLQGVTDSEALLHVSETNPIGLYVKYGVDVNNKNFKESESFQNIENARIFTGDNFSMTLDVYIERFLLIDEEVRNSYRSIYDMGNPYELDEKECEINALAIKIVMSDMLIEEDITTWSKSKETCDIRAAKVAREAAAEDAKELVNMFTRKDGGYIEQLKMYLDLDLKECLDKDSKECLDKDSKVCLDKDSKVCLDKDLNAFDYGNIVNKRERVKIFYLLYLLKTKYFPNNNILEMLSKPSMENIDNSFWGWNTSNGQFIKVIKHTIEKEITLELKNNINNTVLFIINSWGDYILGVQKHMNFLAEIGHSYNFDDDIRILRSALEEKINLENVTKFNSPSPLETLYLKLVQHEYLGQIKDILMLHSLQADVEYHVPPEYVNAMIKFKYKKISREDIDLYFEVENVQNIAKFVYLKSEINKEERRKIRGSKDKVLRFLNFCFWGGINDWEDVSELLIISCLQTIMLDKQGNIFDYTFYGYEGKKGGRKGKMFVQGALKNDEHTYDALQIYWVYKVMDRSYANIGRYDIKDKLRELENMCCRIIEKILSISKIGEMLYMHNLYYHRLTD